MHPAPLRHTDHLAFCPPCRGRRGNPSDPLSRTNDFNFRSPCRGGGDIHQAPLRRTDRLGVPVAVISGGRRLLSALLQERVQVKNLHHVEVIQVSLSIVQLIYQLIYHPSTTSIRRALVVCDGPPCFVDRESFVWQVRVVQATRVARRYFA